MNTNHSFTPTRVANLVEGLSPRSGPSIDSPSPSPYPRRRPDDLFHTIRRLAVVWVGNPGNGVKLGYPRIVDETGY